VEHDDEMGVGGCVGGGWARWRRHVAQNPAPRAHTATILMTGGTYLGWASWDVDSERAKTLSSRKTAAWKSAA